MKKLSNAAAVILVLALSACQRAATNHGPAIAAEQFTQDVEKSTGVVLVDFWATWCGPCKMMNPVVDAAEKKYAGRLKVVRVDVDTNRDLAQKYGIEAIPTYMLFQGGHVMETRQGATGGDDFNHWLETALGKAAVEGG